MRRAFFKDLDRRGGDLDGKSPQKLAGFGSGARIIVGVFHSDAIVGAGLASVLGVVEDIEVQALGRAQMPATSGAVIVTDARSAIDYIRLRDGGDFPGGSARLLVIAHVGREWEVREALAAGAHGYLLQNCELEQLITAVRSLSRGRRYVCEEQRYLNDEVIGLTQRETDVLQLMALGHCNKKIARDLGIGVGTVKSHAKGLFSKLGATARTHAVVIASRRGLVDDTYRERNMQHWI